MKYSIFILTGCLLTVTVYAQLDNQSFEQRFVVQPLDSGKLFLGIDFLGFGKNNEYFNTVVDGYTLFGYQLNPHVSYHLTKNVRVDAGVYLQKDFGNNLYSAIAPTLSLKIQKNDFAFVFGTLEGSLNHHLIEPLYDFEKVLKNRLENGIQLLWQSEKVFFDAWVDWQNMIYHNDDEQEQFVAGLSFNGLLWKYEDFMVNLPVQFVAYHKGGQIDQNPAPLTSFINSAMGIEVTKQCDVGWFRKVGIKSYWSYSQDLSSASTILFDRGNGLYVNPFIKTKFGLTLMGSYWKADEFITMQGGLLFSSVNTLHPERIDVNREWFMLRFLYDLKVADGLILSVRFEPLYDSYGDALEYSYGFYLNFQNRFFLLNAKNN